MDWSQNSVDSGCFMVNPSQNGDMPNHQAKLFEQLVALRTIKTNTDAKDQDMVGTAYFIQLWYQSIF